MGTMMTGGLGCTPFLNGDKHRDIQWIQECDPGYPGIFRLGILQPNL